MQDFSKDIQMSRKDKKILGWTAGIIALVFAGSMYMTYLVPTMLKDRITKSYGCYA